jgi:uncharacterized protein involved in response to NO
MSEPGATPRTGSNVTRGERMLALRRRRWAATHPVLRGGFRPFFLGGAIWAVVAIALWLGMLAGAIGLPTRFDPVAWHRHEMLFGFVGAAISGFLLTAIPNWTGRLPIAGRPLLALFGLWAAARVAVAVSGTIGLWPAAILDVGLFVSLALMAGREVMASNNRNVPVVALVFVLGLADAADYGAAAGLVRDDVGWRGAVALIIVLISLIGGRIIPSFTRNWMAKRGMKTGLPTQPQALDLIVIAVTAVALLGWLVLPGRPAVGPLLFLAAAAQALRLSRWSGYRTFGEPLLLILHVGYAWIPIGLLLLGLSLTGGAVPESAGIHALTAGAMTTMILAVMSRASLGHTARELRASPVTVLAYICVTLGAALRVIAFFAAASYPLMLDLAGALWGAALLLFVIVYAPILWSPRLGDEPPRG